MRRDAIDTRSLPASVLRIPAIRALTLAVYPNGDDFKVPGTRRIYDVFRVGINTLRCTCTAAMHGLTCSHALAVQRYIGDQPKEKPKVSKLAGALPRQSGGMTWKKTELHLGLGDHRGYFLGLSEPVTEETQYPCRACKGERVIREQQCRACKGTGRQIEEKVAIRYQMGPELIEEEWVNFLLSGPGKTKDGGPKKATTLWRRLNALSSLTDNEALQQWYDDLEAAGSIRIPITMLIEVGDNGKAVITSVRLYVRQAPATQTQAGFGDDLPA